MKKIINYKLIIFASLMCLAAVSCKKFEVLKNIDPDLVDAGVNLKTESIWTFISERNLVNKGADTLKSLDLYAASIERVGLRPLLEADGNLTVIAPRNEALKALAVNLGYTTVDEIPAAVLRNIFLDNMISTRIKSFELEADSINLFQTLNEDSLSIARQPSSTNQYVLNLYNASSLSTSAVNVRSQNLECKNGIVHIVDEIKTYRPKFVQPDAAKESGDTIYVSKDAYLNNGSATNKASNFGDAQYMWIKKNSNGNLTRRAIMQFTVRNAIKFTENIAGVTLYMHCNRFDYPGGTLSVYEDANVDWNEVNKVPADPNFPGINWANAPTPGIVELSNISFSGQTRTDTVISASVGTAYKAALANGETFINFGLNTTANIIFQILTKETLDENLMPGKYSSFLVLTPEQVTMLVNPVNTGLVVDLKKGYKKIRTTELSFGGTESRNVTYTITSSPTNGFIVVDGNSNVTGFTQAQIEKGSVKYLYSGDTAGSDSFTVTARDSEGNSYATPQVVNVQIQ
nr:cadherin-like domain-containing protein [uncultured Pedobacter sp.]